MRKLYDFRCDCGLFEAYTDTEARTIRCKHGHEAKRVISAVKCSLDPISGHFPSATDKWAKHHEVMAKRGESAQQ